MNNIKTIFTTSQKYKYSNDDTDDDKQQVKLHQFKEDVRGLTPYALDKPYNTWITAFKKPNPNIIFRQI